MHKFGNGVMVVPITNSVYAIKFFTELRVMGVALQEHEHQRQMN